jgi:ABC-type multidrug transport system permease subunit
MPWFLRIISNSLPSTPFFSAYTKIALMGSNINAVIPDILHLVILATAWTIIATIKLKLLSKNIQRDSVLPECIS